MHPTDRKSYIYATIIIAFALTLIIFSIARNIYSVIFHVTYALYVLTRKKLNLKQKLVFLAIVVDMVTPFLLFVEYMIHEHDFTGLIIFTVVFSLFLYIIINAVYSSFLEVLEAAGNERKHYEVVKGYPYVICKEHLAKTEIFTDYGYTTIHCRVDINCLEANNLKVAKKLVGVIGPMEIESNNNYNVILWDNETGEIKNGDYDIIQIIGSKDQTDYNYDYVIAKVVYFLYNELERLKPIHRISVQIIGNPNISISTKRLLEEKFLKVEYASN